MKRAARSVGVAALLCVGVAAAAQPTAAHSGRVHPTAEDIAALRRAGSPALSPDGLLMVYTVAWAERNPDAQPSDDDTTGGWTRHQQLFLAGTDGDEAIQLTFDNAGPSSPVWRPDSQAIAFIRSGRIHILPFDGGESVDINTGDLTPTSLAFAPGGERIAFLAEPPLSQAEKAQRWRSGGAEDFGKRWRNSRLYVVDLASNGVRAVTDGGRNVVRFAWSPDGSRFLVVASPTAEPHDAFILHTLRIIDAGSGAQVRALENKPAIIGQIAWSPDGRFIAYERADGGLSLLNSLIVQDADGGRRRNAARLLDPSLAGFAWEGDSRTLIAHVQEGTRSTLYRLARDGGRATPLPFNARVITGSLSASANGTRLAFLASDDEHPPDPAALDVASGWWRRVAEINPQVEDWTLGAERVVRWTNNEGDEVEGLLLETPREDVGDLPPLMVLPHGGPDSVSTGAWSTWAQFFAARGFSVFRPNYRGSFGYGFDFYAANRGRLGEVEFADIESGVDALIERGLVDPERMVFAGWSWGGFTTAYTITHTNRYKAAVVGAGVIDTANQYVASDINHGVAAQWEFKGDPWRQPEAFDRASAARHVLNATTPTLIIHGRSDDRVPFVQGLTLYRALSDLGVEVKFLAYPREPHGFREPAHVAHMLDAWAQWCLSRLPTEAQRR